MKRGQAFVYAVKPKNADRFVDAATACGAPTLRLIGEATDGGYRIVLYEFPR
jgi:hypothetical protein